MQIYTRASAAVSALIAIVLLERGKAVSLSEIAERNHMSVSNLEALFNKLRTAGIVRGVRGPGGGYLIARPLNEILIADIVEAVDTKNVPAVHHQSRQHEILGQALWQDVNKRAMDYLARTSLADVVQEERNKGKTE